MRSTSDGLTRIHRSATNDPRRTKSAHGRMLRSKLSSSTGRLAPSSVSRSRLCGQRRSDVHRMTWADVNEGTIRVVQQKTGRKLAIPLHRDLLALLAVANRDHG